MRQHDRQGDARHEQRAREKVAHVQVRIMEVGKAVGPGQVAKARIGRGCERERQGRPDRHPVRPYRARQNHQEKPKGERKRQKDDRVDAVRRRDRHAVHCAGGGGAPCPRPGAPQATCRHVPSAEVGFLRFARAAWVAPRLSERRHTPDLSTLPLAEWRGERVRCRRVWQRT